MGLSRRSDEMRARYEVVVVGSGYGGAIAASRLSRAGRAVCVLEQGREFGAGDFPATELEAVGELQVDLPDRRVGDENGLYHFHVDRDISVFHGCGLGGTSLVNANVSLRPEAEVFASERWPVELQKDLTGRVEEGFRHAVEMLRPTTSFPIEYRKLRVLEESARELDQPFIRTPINVNFQNFSGGNHVGVPQAPCTHCGDCVSGCNYTAKNTTAMNYLPDAVNHGAEIFCEVRVRYLAREGDRWRVFYEVVGSGREEFDAPLQFVEADVVVLGAGSLGSTEILLRSRDRGLSLSSRLGHGFSGNADVLGFNFNADVPVNAIGLGHRDPEDAEPVGPCITGAIDVRPQEGMIIEEGVAPGPVGRLIPATLLGAARAVGEDTDSGLLDEAREAARGIESLVRGPYHGAAHHTQTYLVMGHDGADGQLRLEDDRLRIHWPGIGESPVFERINRKLRQVAGATGGTFVRNPIWSDLFEKPLITVHPLGGCNMGRDAESGVVNHKGQVFDGPAGQGVHDGLYVADAAVIPTSVGVNPLLTISALAERSCALLAEDRGWSISYDLPSTPVRRETAVQTAGVQFTETMAGFFSKHEKEDFGRGFERGRQEDSPFRFVLTIRTDDVEAMIDDPDHRARMIGTVEAPALSSKPMMATEGEFRLFRRSDQRVATKEMVYRMKLSGDGSSRYFFHGFKTIKSDAGIDLWPDTTTLAITVYEGDDATGPIVGRGLLHIAPEDFAVQLRTMKALHARDGFAATAALARFGVFFAGELWDTYGGIAGPSKVFADEPPRKRRPLRAPAPEVHGFSTADGAALRLTRYRAGAKGPVVLAPGFSNKASVFALDTPETSFVEFLAAHGYDIWLFDRRSSPALAAAASHYTFDDVAGRDWPAALGEVKRLTGRGDVQVVAHCMGSMTLLMASMLGMEGVRSAVCSQVTAFFDTSWDNELKAALRVAELAGGAGIDTLTTDVSPTWRDAALDGLLRLYPRAPEERCDLPRCRRIFGIFGPVYRHANLDRATHRAVGEVFGVASSFILRHMTRIFRVGHAVDAEGKDVYLPNLSRLNYPIHFIAGARNQIAKPSSSKKMLDALHRQFGPGLHTREVFDDYAHMDCFLGRDAARDVFPSILKHLDLHEGA